MIELMVTEDLNKERLVARCPNPLPNCYVAIR